MGEPEASLFQEGLQRRDDLLVGGLSLLLDPRLGLGGRLIGGDRVVCDRLLLGRGKLGLIGGLGWLLHGCGLLNRSRVCRCGHGRSDVAVAHPQLSDGSDAERYQAISRKQVLRSLGETAFLLRRRFVQPQQERKPLGDLEIAPVLEVTSLEQGCRPAPTRLKKVRPGIFDRRFCQPPQSIVQIPPARLLLLLRFRQVIA
ncbi:MAG: hypothetical protein ACTHNY_05580 [Solirubrobacterales bacterium]